MRFLAVLLMLVFGPVASAATGHNWKICDLTVKVLKVNDRERMLRASVQRREHRSAGAQCPSPGVVMAFVPETMDYQKELPRRLWPHAGETAVLQYRYLDGFCHNDGHDGPCRVRHYSMMPR